MNNEYTENLEEIATHGFEVIDPEETVDVNLKDLMYVFSTLQEYQRFFQQPLHYQNMEDIEKFLGSVDSAAGFKLLHTAIHKKMRNMLPKHIDDKYGEGDFDSPKLPFYYNTNR